MVRFDFCSRSTSDRVDSAGPTIVAKGDAPGSFSLQRKQQHILFVAEAGGRSMHSVIMSQGTLKVT